MLLLATARPDFTPPWPARSNLTTVQLARLTKRQARDMVERLAGKGRQAGTPAPPEQKEGLEEGKSNGVAQASLPAHLISNEVLEQIVARADGIPLYLEELLKRTRQQLHARVAQVLEARFPERVSSGPEVIARHYDQAGLAAQAIGHYQRAGERATQRSANEEAIGHLRALDLVGTLPETRERHQMELGLQMAIGAPLSAARGFSHPECEGTYTRARELTSQIGESPELARVLVGMAVAYFAKRDLATAADVAQEALAAAERTGDVFDLLIAHIAVGGPLLLQGHFSRALQHCEDIVKLYNPSAHVSQAYTVGADVGVVAHGYAAQCHMALLEELQ